jgi:hypothetical protein
MLAEQHDEWIEGRRYFGLDGPFNATRSRLAILVRCSMPMNAQSWSACAVRTPNCVWTVSF